LIAPDVLVFQHRQLACPPASLQRSRAPAEGTAFFRSPAAFQQLL